MGPGMNPHHGLEKICLALVAAMAAAADRPLHEAPDLMPVRQEAPPRHAPVTIVRDGEPAALVYVADPAPSPVLKLLLDELVEDVRLSSGASLQVVTNPPPPEQAAIVIGDCAESRGAGIDAAAIPIEGFVVMTASNRVFLVGSAAPLPAMDVRNLAGTPYANDGTAWAVADFLERFVGVRWYWPVEAGGRSILRMSTISVPACRYSDAPVFRKREFYPRHGYTKDSWRAIWWDRNAPRLPAETLIARTDVLDMRILLAGLRMGNSWPFNIKVHEPQHFARESEKWSKTPEMFQRNPDGSPDLHMLCYSSDSALEYLLKGCEDSWEHGRMVSWVTTTCVTVSPGDYPVNCHCARCRQLFDASRAPYGSASRIMGMFVRRMCEAVKARWPDKKVLFLAYWNYTDCPEDIEFPDNLQVQMCTMAFGLMRQPSARGHMEKQLRAWSAKVGGRVTTWEYSHRIHEWTCAPVQYPHLVRDYYRANRDILAGSFLNGGQIGEWSTGAPTDYCWMRILWNPDVNVDAILDEMCSRLFGKASATCRELLRLECERWETALWRESLGDAGKVSAPVFADTYPPDVVDKMAKLRDKARQEMEGDPVSAQRFAYWTWTFDYFLEEARKAWAEARSSDSER